ncbi:hypothetical protein R50912_10785 [Paenibacillus sp. FSL R5-0912]|nr:hypothetical protein R50912_10785 [Paenibacillus sp. FSL R5-0912]
MHAGTVLLQSYSVYEEILIHFQNNINVYLAEQDGVKLLKWLGDAVNDRKPYSVGSKFLTMPEPAQR